MSNPQLYGETMRATRREFMKEQLWWLVLVGGDSKATALGWGRAWATVIVQQRLSNLPFLSIKRY